MSTLVSDHRTLGGTSFYCLVSVFGLLHCRDGPNLRYSDSIRTYIEAGYTPIQPNYRGNTVQFINFHLFFIPHQWPDRHFFKKYFLTRQTKAM